jgi:hypothetical protein
MCELCGGDGARVWSDIGTEVICCVECQVVMLTASLEELIFKMQKS